MSYLVLARKSRPQKFEQVVGQKTIVTTLKNSLLRERVAHAILFSGIRGTGKTTLARIMAKAINCESPLEQRPCCTCKSCQAIASGSAIDLHEIDGASNRGIQEIRELKEQIKFLPVSSRFKIIIIDEVHMLTTEAFNALLKTLEEPPKHVYFMFATTELHKIPITILSRCQRYELKRIAADDLQAHFRKLAADEGVNIEEKALQQIVKEADGSVRDGLSLLDQIFSYGEKEVRLDDVTEVLGLVSREVLLKLAAGLMKGDKAGVLLSLDEIFAFGMDIKRFGNDLLDCFRNLLLCKIKGCETLLNISETELQSYQEIAGEFPAESIHAKLVLLMAAIEDTKNSSQPRLALETSFIKVIEAGNIVHLPDLIGKLDKLIDMYPPQQEPVQDAADKAVAVKDQDDLRLTEPRSVKKTDTVTEVRENKEPPAAEPVSQVSTAPPDLPPEKGKAAAKNIQDDWREFIEYVKGEKIWMGQILQKANNRLATDGELQLEYDEHFTCGQLKEPENHQILTRLVQKFFQKELKVSIITPENSGDTASPNDRENVSRQKRKLSSEPLVTRALEIFNGQIVEVRLHHKKTPER
ncbi:MAG: hypothetical protein CSB24_02435 [Deltaproteobacteria bacterium]|nr:MAG: hypothetical protein CSB24_02435 [Deltaproteobacteria bacterium]